MEDATSAASIAELFRAQSRRMETATEKLASGAAAAVQALSRKQGQQEGDAADDEGDEGNSSAREAELLAIPGLDPY